MSALVPYEAPELSPEAAEQCALVIRAELDRRPDDATIRAWLQYVAVAVARPRPTEDEIVMLTGILLDGEYPAAVFNATTRREAARRFKYWPSAAEVFELLAPHIADMGIELPDLDRVVRNARRPRIVPAREAFGYDPGPANPEWKRGRPPAHDPKADAAAAAERTKETEALQKQADESRHEQLARLAAMGVDITPKRAGPSPLQPSLLDALYVAQGVQGPRGPTQQDNPPPPLKRKRAGRLEVVR